MVAGAPFDHPPYVDPTIEGYELTPEYVYMLRFAQVTLPGVYMLALAFTLAAFTLAAVKDPFANTLPWLYMPLELHTIQSLGSGPPVVVYLPRHKMDDVYEFDVYTRNVPPPFCPRPYRSVGP